MRRVALPSTQPKHNGIFFTLAKTIPSEMAIFLIFMLKLLNRLYCLVIKKMLLCEMEILHFLLLIWDHYLPLAPTYNDRPP